MPNDEGVYTPIDDPDHDEHDNSNLDKPPGDRDTKLLTGLSLENEYDLEQYDYIDAYDYAQAGRWGMGMEFRHLYAEGFTFDVADEKLELVWKAMEEIDLIPDVRFNRSRK